MRKTLVAAAVGAILLGHANAASAQKCGQPFEVLANTPKETIAKMVVHQIFSGIKLTDAQHAKAVQTVLQSNEDARKLDTKAADYTKQFAAVNEKRNAELMKLASSDADKAKLNTCFKQMQRQARGG